MIPPHQFMTAAVAIIIIIVPCADCTYNDPFAVNCEVAMADGGQSVRDPM